MRKLKWILGGLVSFVVALLVAGYVIVANYPVEELKRLIEQEAEALTGRKLAIRGGAAMDISLSPSIVLEDVHFADADWAGEGDMVSMKRFEMQVELWPLINGEIAIERFVMVEPVILLRRNEAGVGNWELGTEAEAETAEAAAEGLTNLPSFQAVSFTDARIVFDDAVSGTGRTLVLESLEATGSDLDSPIAVAAHGSLDDVPFDLSIDLPGVRTMASGGAIPVELEGQLANATLRLDGRVAPLDSGENDFRLWLAGDDLQELGSGLGVAGLPAGPFDLEALVQQNDAEVLSLPVLKGSLDGTAFQSTLVIRHAATPPRVNGDFHAGRLVVPTGAEEGGGGSGNGLIPDDPLPLELLRAADVTLSITLDELVLGKRSLTDLVTSLSLENGRLRLDPLSFGYRDGKVEGSVVLDASVEPPALELVLDGNGLDLGEATGGAITGSLTVDLDLQARGESPKAMAATLSGRSALSSGDGRIDNQLLAVASAPLAGALGPLFGGDGEVGLTCLINRFAWQDGIGTNQGTAVDAETFSVIGNGTVNLRNETIDFYVDTWSKDTALIGVAVPLTVTGSLASPSIAPDPAGTALGLAKTAGLIVFPPAGLAAIIDDRASAQSGNPCVAAVEEVQEQGGPANFFEDLGNAAGEAVDEVIDGAGDAADEAGDAIERGLDDATDGFNSLFD